MQLTALFLTLSVTSTASAAPLLFNKRNPKTFYTIDGEEILRPGRTPYLDPNSHIIYPVDWPRYDTWKDQYCQPHSKDAPRLQVGTWWEQCPSKTLQWQIDHNTFVSREAADQARLDEERRRQDAERERQDDKQRREQTLASCRQTPNTKFCRGLLSLDAAGKKKQKQKQEENKKEQQGGNGV